MFLAALALVATPPVSFFSRATIPVASLFDSSFRHSTIPVASLFDSSPHHTIIPPLPSLRRTPSPNQHTLAPQYGTHSRKGEGLQICVACLWRGRIGGAGEVWKLRRISAGSNKFGVRFDGALYVCAVESFMDRLELRRSLGGLLRAALRGGLRSTLWSALPTTLVEFVAECAATSIARCVAGVVAAYFCELR
jgi:hypothetical protein